MKIEEIMNKNYEELSLKDKIKKEKWLIKEMLWWKKSDERGSLRTKKFLDWLKLQEPEAGSSVPEMIEWEEKMLKHYLDEVGYWNKKIILHESKLKLLNK